MWLRCGARGWAECGMVQTEPWGPMVLNWGQFYSLGDIGQCLKVFLAFTAGGCSAPGTPWVEAWHGAKHLLCTGLLLHKELSGPNVIGSRLRNADIGPCRPVQGLWILLQASWEAIRGWEQRSDMVSAMFWSRSGCCQETRLQRDQGQSRDLSGGFCRDLSRTWR